MKYVLRLLHYRHQLWWHRGLSDAQPFNGWQSYVDHCLDHDRIGL